MAILLHSKIQRLSKRLDAHKKIKLLVSASRSIRLQSALVARLKARVLAIFLQRIPVACEKSRWILTPRRASETRGDEGTRRRWKTTRARLANVLRKNRDCLAIAVVGDEIKRSRRRAPPRERASMKGKDERAQGKKISAAYVFHTGMHGSHQFSVKPINLQRALPENEAFDGWRTRQRCKRHAATLFRVMTKNRRNVHVNRKPLSREEIRLTRSLIHWQQFTDTNNKMRSMIRELKKKLYAFSKFSLFVVIYRSFLLSSRLII